MAQSHREAAQRLFEFAQAPDVAIQVDVAGGSLVVSGAGRQEAMQFEISPFDQALVLAGGWVDYADKKY